MSLANIKNNHKTGTQRVNIDGMEQLKTDQLIGKDVTLINCDVIKTKNGMCGIMIFKEFPNSFYFAGSVLTDLCIDITSDPDGAIDDLQKDGLKLSIFKQKSEKSNREYVTYRIKD